MVANTVKLHLDGNVSLGLFADGIQHFRGLIDALSIELSREAPIEWEIEELAGGSATAVIRGVSQQPASVESVCRAVVDVGKAIQRHQRPLYGETVRLQARGLYSILNGRVTAITLETPEDDVTIYTGQSNKDVPPPMLRAYGAVVGRVETLSRRGGLRFSLYDTLDDRSISCYLQEGLQDRMRDAWGHRAIVEGMVSRDPTSGRAINIRQVNRVDVVPDILTGSYLRARGVVQVGPNGLAAEAAIRRVRDAE